MRLTTILCCAAMLGCASISQAKIHLVRQDGSGDFTDIASAITAAIDGDIVLVGDGTYTGVSNRNLDPGGRAVTIAAENGPATCIIDCESASGSRGFHVHGGEGAGTVIRGFTIRNARESGIYIAGSSPTIRNNVIENCESSTYGGGLYAGASSSVIVNNVIDHNETNLMGDDGGGVYLDEFTGTLANNVISYNSTSVGGDGAGIFIGGYTGGVDCLLVNNLVFENDGNGTGSEGGGLYVDDASVDVYNCTFYRNQCYESGSGAGVHGSGGSTSLRNTIIWNNQPGLQVSGNLGFLYCCVTNGVSGETNISDNPQFSTGPGGNLYLATGSPCVDTGGDPASGVCFDGTGAGVSFCLDLFTTRADQTADTGTVDMGYHYSYAGARYVPDHYTTIQDAIDAAVPGGEIVVRANATPYQPIDFLGKPIAVRSESGALATMISGPVGQSRVTAVRGESTDSIVEGFTVKNGDFVNYGAGIMCNGASPRLHELSIQWNGAGRGGGLACRAGSSPWLTSTVVHTNGAEIEGGALYCDGGSDPRLNNVTIYQGTAPDGGSVAALGDSHPLLENCLVVNGAGAGLHAHVEDTSTITARCCDVWNNENGDWVGGLTGQGSVNDNFTADPLFCDADADDYSLHDNSPCAAANSAACGLVGAVPAGGCGDYHPLVCPDGSGDFTTIQAAIDDAENGWIIELCDGVFTGAGNRDVSFLGKAITVRSRSGNPAACIVHVDADAADQHRGFVFENGEEPDSVLQGVTIKEAYTWHAAGLFCEAGASPTIDNCIIEYNTAASRGGGVSVHNLSSPTFTGCIIRWNIATTDGGGVRCYHASPTFVGCEIYGNHAEDEGGGVYLNATSSPTFSDCLISSNNADTGGGGLYVRETSEPVLDGCTIIGNSTYGDGGGLYLRDSSHARLDGCTLWGNTGDVGSGISAYSSSWPVIGNTIISYGQDGQAVFCETGAGATLTCCDIWDNDGGNWVGFIAAQAGIDGNFEVDPGFCGASGGDYTLQASSFCAEENNPGCGQIGAWPIGCAGGTWIVDPGGGGHFLTIQAAIDAAAEGDVIELVDAVYTGSGNRDVTYRGKAVTVRSQSGNPAACVVDCEADGADQHRGFLFNSGEGSDSVLADITITGAYTWHAAGLFCEAGASPTITGCILEHNTAESRGGGMSAHNGSAPVVSDCVFRWNIAAADGGGLRCYSSAPSVTDCEFYANHAGDEGGGIYLDNASSPTFTGCLFDDNDCDADGGAVFATYNCQPGFTDCTVSNNIAGGDGGGFYLWHEADARLDGCTLYGNGAENGSGIFAGMFSTPAVETCIIAHGAAGQAVACDEDSDVTLICTDIYGNHDGNWFGCIAGQAGLSGNIEKKPYFCDAAGGDFTLAQVSACLPGNNTCGVQMGAFGHGCDVTGTLDPDTTPRVTRLMGCYPNPFNPSTTIVFSLAEPGRVTLSLHDAAGRLVVRLLDDEIMPASEHRIVWNGSDSRGRAQSSGTYLVRFKTNSGVESLKVSLIR